MANPFDSTIQQHVSTRPLTAGMFQNLPSNGLPPGAFWRIQNYRVQEQGLSRRGGLVEFDSNIGVGQDQYDEQLFDIIYFYQRSGGAEQLLLSSTKLYRMDGGGQNYNMSYRALSSPVITNTATDLEGKFIASIAGTQEDADRVRPGDYVLVNGIEYPTTGAVFTTTVDITLSGTVLADALVGLTLTSDERFISEPRLGPQYAVLPSVGASTDDKVIIVDQAERGPYQYTSAGGLEPFVIDSTDGVGGTTNFVLGAKTVTYFDDRLWFGSTEEVDGTYKQRIRWTDAVNFDRIAPASYTDLPYSEGALLRLVPLGALLVAYFEDAIYLGRRTNMAGQPYYFERMESGNAGLINARAVVRHVDAHYLVGPDNIYRLSGSAGYQPIGAPILEEAVYFTKDLLLMNEVQVEHDPVTESIVFLFPDIQEVAYESQNSVATRLWRFYYKTNAWAYDEVSFLDAEKTNWNYLYAGLLPSNTFVFGRSWEDWEAIGDNAQWTEALNPAHPNYPTPPTDTFEEWGTWWALSNSQTLGTTLKIPVLSAPLGKEVILEEAKTAEQDEFLGLEYPIWALLESGDHDVGMPDYTKTVTRLSIKAMHIYSERTSPLVEVGGVFTLNISDAMGYHWKRPMTLRFKRNYNEGYANFRSTGSTFRFKLINSQVIAPYLLSEYIMRLVGRGLQVEN